jgi:hypothetical protein
MAVPELNFIRRLKMLGTYNLFTGGYIPIEKSRMLKDIETTEVSLVSEPATRKRFLFMKSDDGTTTDSLIQRLEESDLDEDEQTEFLKMLSRISDSGELIGNLAETKVQKSADPWPSLSPVMGLGLLQGSGIGSDELEDEL